MRTTLAATALLGVTLALAALARAERERRSARADPDRLRRHFGLLADEPPAEGLRRIALGQLDIAIEQLCVQNGDSPGEAVHEVRKALKRLRALLRLLEDELGSQLVASEQSVLGDAADRLAGARDAEVMVQTLEALLHRNPRQLASRRGVGELRTHLARERVRASRRVTAQADGAGSRGRDGDWSAEPSRTARDLIAMRERVNRWALADGPALELVGRPLKRIYREGRDHRDLAAARRPGTKALHRWRKQVKDLRYAAEVLDVRESQPRRSSRERDGRIRKLARRADALGELLGEEHDLAVLAEVVRAHKPLKRRRKARRALLRAIARRRARLRKRSLSAGAGIYARKPKRFLRWAAAGVRAR